MNKMSEGEKSPTEFLTYKNNSEYYVMRRPLNLEPFMFDHPRISSDSHSLSDVNCYQNSNLTEEKNQISQNIGG